VIMDKTGATSEVSGYDTKFSVCFMVSTVHDFIRLELSPL